MSIQFNPEINSAQAPAASTELSTDALTDEDLDAVAGGAVVIGNGGFDISLTPIRRRVLITNGDTNGDGI